MPFFLDGHGVREVDLGISGESIAAIATRLPASSAQELIDASGLHVLPGAIDSHMHWGYHGDFRVQCRSDSLAAAIGGTTTAHVLHRVTPGTFDELVAIGDEVSTVDYLVTPTVYSEATAGLVPAALEEWGVSSFKFYLAYKPVDGHLPGDDWNELTDGLMAEALAMMSRRGGTLACVHAENPEIIARRAGSVRARGGSGLRFAGF
jgi:dihydropyrimidinase